MSEQEKIIQNIDEDQAWADLLAPTRRNFLVSAGLAAAGLTVPNLEINAQEKVSSNNLSPIVPHLTLDKVRGVMKPTKN